MPKFILPFLTSIPLLCLLAGAGPELWAQTLDWRAEMAAAQQAAQASTRAALPLALYIRQWRSTQDSTGRSVFSGGEQAEWARLMSAFNRNLQSLMAFSDRHERARKLALDDFAKWSGSETAGQAELDQLRLRVQLLESDRAVYSLTDSLRSAAENSAVIIQRLNEGNRSFGLQYGIFEQWRADYFDVARRHRTRSRYLQLAKQGDFIAGLKESEPQLHAMAQRLAADPTLQEIARKTDAEILWDNSRAALAAAFDPARDLAARTFHNGSQFFGNLVGDNLFRLADLVGIGESRGHDLPAFHRYYAHPHGRQFGVHPVLADEIERQLLPGDVLFEKTRFAITDKLIPGYFGHVAIYLKSYAALQALGVFETKEILQASNGMTATEIAAQVESYAAEITAIPENDEWLKLAIMRRRLAARRFNGAPLPPLLFEALYRLKEKHENVLEALRDGQAIAAYDGGVTLNRFEHFLYVDDFAATRLKGEAQDSSYQKNLARFLALGLLQYGKPYDFRFDVNTLDAIVCSELIYQSFVDIDFSTGKSLATYTISPDQVAQEAGPATVLAGQRLAPAFALQQWYAEAMPLYPAATGQEADTLVQRAFMAMVREELGSLQMLAPSEREAFQAHQAWARQARAAKSAELRETPAPRSPAEPAHDPARERSVQNLFITTEKQIHQSKQSFAADTARAVLRRAAMDAFPASASATQSTLAQERAAALGDVFQRWQNGPAYRLNYDELYSGKQKFFLSIFRSLGVMDDRGFGRGFGLRLAGNNEAPQRAVRYVQYYSFLPLELQIFDNSGTVTQRWQGGAGLASIRRSYFHGDEIHMNALAWRSTAYASSFIPFAMAAGGDKGPLSAALKLMTIGNGDFQRGLYFGEFAAAQLAPYETRQGKSAFTILNLSYGGKLQMVLGRLHAYGRGALGVRLGNYGERENQSVQAAFPQIRDWAFGVELFGASLYRPAIHRLEFSVSEDGARFLSGRIVPDRQARLAYSWLLSK